MTLIYRLSDIKMNHLTKFNFQMLHSCDFGANFIWLNATQQQGLDCTVFPLIILEPHLYDIFQNVIYLWIFSVPIDL